MPLFHRALRNRSHQFRPAHLRRPGHLDIEPRKRGPNGFIGAPPIGDHNAVKAPAIPEDFREQAPMGRTVDSPKAMVGGHKSPGPAHPNRAFEGVEVALGEGLGIDLHRHAVPFRFAVIGDEMLRAGGHALALHPAHERLPQGRGQFRILAVGLEVAPSQEGALQIDGGA